MLLAILENHDFFNGEPRVRASTEIVMPDRVYSIAVKKCLDALRYFPGGINKRK